MGRKLLPLLCLLLLLIPFSAARAAPEEPEEDMAEVIRQQVQELLAGLDVGQWDESIDPLAGDLAQFAGTGARELIASIAMEGLSMDPASLLQSLAGGLKLNLRSHLGLLAMLVALGLLTGIVRTMTAGDKNRELVGLICYCLAVAVILATFLRSMDAGRTAMARLSAFVELAFPVLLALLSAVGAVNATGVMQPVTTVLTTTVTGVLRDVVMPLVTVSGVLAVVNNLTGRVQIKEFSSLAKSLMKWIMGLTVTVYLGVCALSGISARTMDGLSLRTAKYALDKFVPIVGGMVSGTVDTLLGCAVLVKNAAGVAAIVIVVGLMLEPLLNIVGTMLVFRLAGALCEPVADERMPRMFTAVAEVLLYLFAALVVLCTMFALTVGIMMGMNGALTGL